MHFVTCSKCIFLKDSIDAPLLFTADIGLGTSVVHVMPRFQRHGEKVGFLGLNSA